MQRPFTTLLICLPDYSTRQSSWSTRQDMLLQVMANEVRVDT